jgi:broad specificity phosphatase PhoE
MTLSLFLIRHSEAGERDRWDGADALRPLTPLGLTQAQALVPRFRGITFTRLVSSPAVRCLQTLEPLATDRHLAIEPAEDLAEGTPAERALALVVGLADAPAALCSHGDVIQAAIRSLIAIGTPVDGKVGFAKGSVWELRMHRGAVAGVRYLPPVRLAH